MTERETFLEQQLAGAVNHLRISQENHAALLREMKGHETRVKATYKERNDAREREAKALRIQITAIQQDAARYAYIRQHQVQIWKLCIAAQDIELDRLIDYAKSKETA